MAGAAKAVPCNERSAQKSEGMWQSMENWYVYYQTPSGELYSIAVYGDERTVKEWEVLLSVEGMVAYAEKAN